MTDCPGPARAAQRRALLTEDGVRLSAVHVRGPVDLATADLAFVVVHGFSGSWRQPRVRRVMSVLSGYGGVVALDQRGHGQSGGRSTLGDKEVLDVEAAVRWARVLGYPRVATVGFSMGASVVLRHAALHRGVDAVVSVSGPAFWYYRGTRAMRRLHWAVEHSVGRALVRAVMGTRLDTPPWPDPPPLPPVGAAALLAPIPVLVVHGDADRYFPLEHPRALHRAAADAAARGGHPQHLAGLWVEEGVGHAEAAVPDELLHRVGGWVLEAAAAPSRGPRVEAP